MVIKMKRGELYDVTALVFHCRIIALRVMTSSLVVVVVVMTSLLFASRDVGLCRTATCPVITRQKPKVSSQTVSVCAHACIIIIMTRSLAVAKRPCDCCMGNITGRRYFADIIGLSSTTVT